MCTSQLRRSGLLGLIVACCAGCWTGSALGASPLTWSSPTTVDAGATSMRVSCPSRLRCLADDDVGNIFATTNPQGPWTMVATLSDLRPGLEPGQAQLADIACPSSTLCAIESVWDGPPDGADSLFVSTGPAGAARGWRSVDPGGPLGGDGFAHFDGLTCTAHDLCAIQVGTALRVSTNPAAASSWHTGRQRGQRTDVHCQDSSCVAVNGSCPTTSLCVLPSGDEILFSTHPAAGKRTWKSRKIDGKHNLLTEVSCAGQHLCIALDNLGTLFVSSRPAGGASSWKAIHLDLHMITGVSCAPSVCVVVDDQGRALAGTRTM